MIQEQKILRKYKKNAHNIETLLHSAGGHQEGCKAHQAGNQDSDYTIPVESGFSSNSSVRLSRKLHHFGAGPRLYRNKE